MGLSFGLGLPPAPKKGGADALHGVQVQAARSPGRTFFRNGLRRSTALTDVATVTRATTAWGFDNSGMLNAYAAGQPVVNTAGLAVYEARTNSVRNPTGLGAVVGTLGSGGALPTNWVQDVGTGLTWSVVGTGVENGLNYVDLRFAGTPSGTFLNVRFEGNTAISAATGDIWTASFSAKLVAGSLTNVSKAQVSIFERTSGGTYVAGGSVLDFMPGSTLKEYRAARTLNGGGTVACVNCAISLVYTSGAALDLTLRIAAPNLKKGADIGDPPILQTTNAAATRNADVIAEAVNIPVGQAFTVTGKVIAPTFVAGIFPYVFHLRSADGLNDLKLHFDGGDTSLYCTGVSAGAAAGYGAGHQKISNVAGSPIGFAISVAGALVTWSINGATATTWSYPGGALAGVLTQLLLGSASSGANQLNSTIRDLNIVMRAYSAAELQAASDVSLVWDEDFTTQTYRYVGDPYLAVTDLPLTTFSRPSGGYGVTTSGQLVWFAAGVPRATDAGLTVEPAATNVLWVNDGTTAALGDISTVGALPNAAGRYWSAAGSAAHGVTRTITGKGVEDGMTYFEVEWSGTPNTSSANGFYFDTTASAQAAAAGQTWTTSAYCKVIGTPTGASLSVGIYGRDAAGAGTEVGANTNIPTATASRKRFANTLALVNGATARVTGGLFAAYTVGVPISVKVRIYLAQVEQGSYATSPIQVNGASATRDADALVSADAVLSPTIVAKFTIPETGPEYGHVFSHSDGTDSNAVTLYYYRTGGTLTGVINTGGVTVGVLALGAATPGQTYKVAMRLATNDFAASKNGAAVVTDTSVTLPAVTKFYRGRATLGGHWGAGLQEIKRLSTLKTNAQLQALAA